MIPTIIFTFLSAFPLHAIAQKGVAECGPSLVAMAPCEPFVQGLAVAPSPVCCSSLDRIIYQGPTCLCLLLSDSALSSFPMNATDALHLPALCNLQVDPSICGGTLPVPHSAPPQVFCTESPNTTVAASPVVTVAPRSSFIGYGLLHNAQARLNGEGQLKKLALAAILTLFIQLSSTEN